MDRREAGPVRRLPRKSRKPEARSTPTAVISPTRVGRMPATVRMPSAAPLRKSSNTGRRERTPKPTM